MAEIQDPLLRRLNHDITNHHMASAALDAVEVIRRDTNLADPINSKLRLDRDAAILIASGVSSVMLQHLGLLPRTHIHGKGALNHVVRNL